MKMNYYPEDDILVIKFSKARIVRAIPLNWNVNIGMTEEGIGEIVVLDAKQAGLLPVEINDELKHLERLSAERSTAAPN